MKTRLRNWPGIVLIIALFLVILVFQDFFLTTVIQPMTLLIWAIIRLLASVHQRIYWAILILVSFIVIIRNLPPDRNLNSRYEETAGLPAMEGYDHWNSLIRQSLTFTADQKLMRTRLTQLLILAVSTSEHREIGKVQSEFFNRELDVPGTIYDFLLDESNRDKKPVTRLKGKLYALLPGWIKTKIRPDSSSAQRSIDQTIAWIEKILEINHEYTSNNPAINH